MLENSMVLYTDAEHDLFWGDEDEEFLDLSECFNEEETPEDWE